MYFITFKETGNLFPVSLNVADYLKGTDHYHRLVANGLEKDIQFCLLLSRKFFEQLSTGAIVLNFAVQLIDVVAHRHQKNLRQNLLVASKQKLPEAVILLNDPEGTLRLDRTVYPEQDTLFTGDALQRLSALLDERLRYLKCPFIL